MAAALYHRGPDSRGTYINPENTIGLAHTRLSIIDLSPGGHQPMMYDQNRYVISFNGEIYNYIELKDSLLKQGFHFKTTSDVEVLLALYALKKEACLEDLDGMFAFVIWDSLEQTLFCCRDRFGEKPFFYYQHDTQFVFASEIKAIREVIPDLKLNLEQIQYFLDNGNETYGNSCYFDQIKTLPAGHYLRISPHKTELKKYWEINLTKQLRYKNREEYVSHFKDLFETSIKRRLRSDVKLGSCLSGGLDSSSIVGFISKLKKDSFQTYSAVFPGLAIDESSWINEVSKYTGVVNYKTIPNSELFLEQIEKLIWHQETPIGSTSNFAQWCVMKLAKDNGVKVLLDGQGSDEFLAGYGDLKYFAIRDHYNNFEFKSFFREKTYFKKYYSPSERLGSLFYADPLLKLFAIKRKEYRMGGTLKERLKYAIHFQLEHLLRSADRNSMAHSIEVRLPFLYHELVEFTFSIPNDEIYYKGKTKHILRESVKGFIPDKVINRTDKIGFAAPQNDWLLNPDVLNKITQCNQNLVDLGLKLSPHSWRNLSAGTFAAIYQ